MAETSWPFHDGVDGTPVLETQWSIMARQWSATGVVGIPGDTNLQCYGNSSGLEVHVRAGRAGVRGHWYDSDAVETLAISANSSGNPRIDRVVLQLDPSADEAVLAVLTGTPAASPSAPALTQTDDGVYELSLGFVAVANGAAGIDAGNVSDDRTFASIPYTPALSSRRPDGPVVGQRIWETDTGYDMVWNGSAWAPVRSEGAYSTFTPTVTGAVANPTVSSATGRYTRVYNRVSGWAQAVITAVGSSSGSNIYSLSLPVTPAAPAATPRLGICQAYAHPTGILSHWQLELNSGKALPLAPDISGGAANWSSLKYLIGTDVQTRLTFGATGVYVSWQFDYEAGA